MNRKTLVIFNPAANGYRANEKFDNVLKLLADYFWNYHFEESRARGDAERIAREYCNKFDVIVAAGGDGTVNEVVNGIVGSDAILGIIPLGAGNDFRRDFKIKSLEHACSVIRNGVVRTVDLGLVTYDDMQRYFCTVLSVGHSAEVVAGMSAEDKARYGKLVYLAAVKEYLFNPARHIRVSVDNKQFFDDLGLIVNVGNSYCAGGGMKLGLGNLEDGLLDICVFGNVSRCERIPLVLSLYTTLYLTHPHVKRTKGKEIIISGDGVPFEADGEMLGSLPAMITVKEKALKVLAPS